MAPELIHAITHHLRQGKTLCLATIIRRFGSAPRDLGSKCLMDKEGVLWGSIGGGILEAEVLSRARDVIERGIPQILCFRLDGKDMAQQGMICGGNVDLFLEPIFRPHLDFWSGIGGEEVASRESLGLATLMEPRHWQQECLPKWILPLRDTSQAPPKALKEALDTLTEHPLNRPQVLELKGIGSVLIEPCLTTHTLFIFGAGHISRYLATIAKMIGLSVVVIDDRPEFANREGFPEADQIVISPFEESFEKIHVTPDSFIVIVTRGHLHDKEVLKGALGTDAGYIGMIGSVRKKEMIFKGLMEGGISQEALQRVYSPIGLKIGAETPQEIAVSIMAEIIKVKAGLKE